MLQLLSALGLFGTVVLVVAFFQLWRSRRAGAASAGRLPWCEWLLVGCVGLTFAALALSGFGAHLLGTALSGYVLLLHVSCGGALAAAATLTLFVLAPRYGFEGAAPAQVGPVWTTLQRLAFWSLALTLLGVVLTPLVAMLPVFGTHGQELLTTLHRFGGLAAVALALCLVCAEARVRYALR